MGSKPYKIKKKGVLFGTPFSCIYYSSFSVPNLPCQEV